MEAVSPQDSLKLVQQANTLSPEGISGLQLEGLYNSPLARKELSTPWS